MTVGKCALCGEIRKCSPKEIEHQEYDACASGRLSSQSYKGNGDRVGADSGFGFRLCKPLA